MTVFSVSKSLNRVKKIPTCVAVNSTDPRFHCSRDMLCDFCVDGRFKMNCLDCY